MTRFYPKGFIGSEDAILAIAKTRDPERWHFERMASAEKNVWIGLGKTLNAEFVYNHLGMVEADKDQRVAMTHRLCDYGDALYQLRQTLYSGELVAYFCDDRGRIDHILKEGWGGDEGSDILLRGIVDLEGGLWRRVVLLKAEAIQALAQSLPPAWIGDHADDREAPPPGLVKNSSDVANAFRAWRESLGGRIPTMAEDIEAMRKVGIKRDAVRNLRKEFPSLPRGKPKANRPPK